MRKTGIFLIYLMFLMSCGDDPAPPTTFSVVNMSSNTIYGFTTYYSDGDNLIDKFQHGDLEPGDTTNTIITENYRIDFYFSYDPGGVKFYSGIPFTLKFNTDNILEINDNVFVEGGTTYHVQNNTVFTLLNVVSYYISIDAKTDQVFHGDIEPDARSAIFSTSRDQIYIEFQLEYNGGLLGVADPFPIIENGRNELRINMDTQLIVIPE